MVIQQIQFWYILTDSSILGKTRLTVKVRDEKSRRDLTSHAGSLLG